MIDATGYADHKLAQNMQWSTSHCAHWRQR